MEVTLIFAMLVNTSAFCLFGRSVLWRGGLFSRTAPVVHVSLLRQDGLHRDLPTGARHLGARRDLHRGGEYLLRPGPPALPPLHVPPPHPPFPFPPQAPGVPLKNFYLWPLRGRWGGWEKKTKNISPELLWSEDMTQSLFPRLSSSISTITRSASRNFVYVCMWSSRRCWFKTWCDVEPAWWNLHSIFYFATALHQAILGRCW